MAIIEYLLSTTGTLATVEINDLGKAQFVHPVVDLNISEFFEEEEIRNSTDLEFMFGVSTCEKLPTNNCFFMIILTSSSILLSD